ncbi:hypothetical protein V8E36_005229 [Tilletia maclaganii]
MTRGARRGASSSAQSRSTSATGSRRTNNAPPPLNLLLQQTLRLPPPPTSNQAGPRSLQHSAASDRDANQRYRQPKDVELQEAKRALQWLHEQLLSPADPSAPSSSASAPAAAGALDGPVTRADYERLLARFHALESAVLQSANPPPTRPDATINNRNPPPGTRAAASAARVAGQQLRQRQAPRPRLRNRVVLNVRGLPPHHPARTKSSLQLLLALKDPIFCGEGVMPLSVEKLRSGDIGINFANQMEVEQLLVSASERWIAEAFPDQEQQPVLLEPTYTQLLTVVIHGIRFASGDGEPLAAALTAANNITFINTRFLTAPARRNAHPDGFGSVLVLCEDPAAKAAALDRGVGTVSSSATSRDIVAGLQSAGSVPESTLPATTHLAKLARTVPPPLAGNTASNAPTALRRTWPTTRKRTNETSPPTLPSIKRPALPASTCSSSYSTHKGY